MRFLLVEDDSMIGESLVRALTLSGHAVDWAQDKETGQESLRIQSYDLVLLDLGLPDGSGMDLLKEERAAGLSIPILILTARDALSEKVQGLDSGADDYIVKPFQLEELEARIRNALRRREGRVQPILNHNGITLDPVTHECRCGDEAVMLSSREYAILYALMEKPGIVLSRMQIEEKIYGWNDDIESNAVEYHIHQLRKKLGRTVILNIRGVGYRIGHA